MSTPEVTEETAPASPELTGLLDQLKGKLGDAVVGSEVTAEDLWIRVEASQWRQVVETAKTDLGMDYFCFLSGIDWLPNPTLGGRDIWDPNAAPEADPAAEGEATQGEAAEGEATEWQTGVAGGDTRFQVFARLYSTRKKVGLTLKADLDPENPTVASIVEVYRGADWHEREAWEMYGFQFEGHPGLRHLYLPGEFEGNPLRKDFPMLAREVKPWPGLVDKEQIPGEPASADDTGSDDTGSDDTVPASETVGASTENPEASA